MKPIIEKSVTQRLPSANDMIGISFWRSLPAKMGMKDQKTLNERLKMMVKSKILRYLFCLGKTLTC